METTPISTQALPSGTRIEEFVIELVLGSGGFGVTYLARDARLERQVVIKENLPAQFCFRDTHSLTVAPRHTHGEDVENFRWSLENFSKEAAMLASLDHPGIVRVLRSFEAFGTAYFVMPFVEGKTLDELLTEHQAKGKRFSEEELRDFLEHVLAALAHLHYRGIYHRDIKPGNLLITNGGVPVLIDFGSARQRLSERSMTVIESPGYTPFEQLQTRGNVGPWSDLYALGATLVKAMTGSAPPKINDRTMGDRWQPLSGRAELTGSFTAGFLTAVDRSLRLPVEERWQDAGEWLTALRSTAAVSMVAPVPPPKPQSLLEQSIEVGTPQAPDGFSLIPEGNFQMGDAWDCMKDAPVHTVQVAAFYMSKYAVTKALWDEVRTWALVHGYTKWWISPLHTGEGKAANHPVHSIDWYDVVKWCNARSEMEGLKPCYSVGGAIYRTERINAVVCNWTANGYRLPTEAEWEKSARGGLCGKRFPWGDTISHKDANFDNKGGETYQTGTSGHHPTYGEGLTPYTSPVGSFSPNGYELYDMAGNVWEWCWDWYDKDPVTSLANPHGAVSGLNRVVRGGSWRSIADYCRVADRDDYDPGRLNRGVGFRVARSSVP
jgi:formylglycine-generating enzyme required for sulfatase activity/predicted Ser/Thr protein kinase